MSNFDIFYFWMLNSFSTHCDDMILFMEKSKFVKNNEVLHLRCCKRNLLKTMLHDVFITVKVIYSCVTLDTLTATERTSSFGIFTLECWKISALTVLLWQCLRKKINLLEMMLHWIFIIVKVICWKQCYATYSSLLKSFTYV